MPLLNTSPAISRQLRSGAVFALACLKYVLTAATILVALYWAFAAQDKPPSVDDHLTPPDTPLRGELLLPITVLAALTTAAWIAHHYTRSRTPQRRDD